MGRCADGPIRFPKYFRNSVFSAHLTRLPRNYSMLLFDMSGFAPGGPLCFSAIQEIRLFYDATNKDAAHLF